MKIASISIVKDEADILEAFVRHNLHFVDRMYVVDDRSSDNTPEILRRLSEENRNVMVVDDGWRGAFHQARRTTGVLKTIRAEQPWDAVLALDGDEFICATDRAQLERELSEIPDGKAGAFSEISYVPGPSDDRSVLDPLQRIRRARIKRPKVFKVLATRSLLQRPALAFDEGNHILRDGETKLGDHLLPTVALAHFSVRSVDQLAIKCIKHYATWRSRSDYNESFSFHLINGARALEEEARFALKPDGRIIGAYLGSDALANAVERPFVERRGVVRWPDLAVSPPYAQLLGVIDQLLTQARLQDELALAPLQRDALQQELDRLKWSTTNLARAFFRLLFRKMRLSLAKRFAR